jgi:glucosamine--fructose-6-phosphate aminotransferase (isomerizing)
MCGIVGYTGKRRAIFILLEALERLEYRGYDSSGVALLEDGRIFVDKKVGKIRELIKSLWGKELNATTGIGHTRWATHGGVCELNAHPHTDRSRTFCLGT